MKKRFVASFACGSVLARAGAAEPKVSTPSVQGIPSIIMDQGPTLVLGGVVALLASSGMRKAKRPARAAKVGDSVPSVSLHKGFPPAKISLTEHCKGKKIVLVPGYLAKEAELKAKGVSEVMVFCVNDGAVMTGWSKEMKCDKGTLITMYGDPRSELTEALGLVLDHPGPMSVLGNPRCKRFSMLIDDGVIKSVNVAEGPDDPAGDSKPDVSLVDKMLKDLA